MSEKAKSDERRVGRAKRQATYMIGAIGFLALFAVGLAVPLFLPYSPMTVYSYEPMPSEVCPGELLGAEMDYELSDAEVDVLRIQPIAVAVDVPGFEEGQRFEGPESELTAGELRPGRGQIESGILRSAPGRSGEWLLGAMVTLRNFPQVQTLEPMANNTTIVLPAEAEACTD